MPMAKVLRLYSFKLGWSSIVGVGSELASFEEEIENHIASKNSIIFPYVRHTESLFSLECLEINLFDVIHEVSGHRHNLHNIPLG